MLKVPGIKNFKRKQFFCPVLLKKKKKTVFLSIWLSLLVSAT